MCEFCKLKESSTRIVYKNNLVFVIPTNIPIVPGHLLICPARHIEKIDQLSKEEMHEIFKGIIDLKKALQKLFGSTGFNFAWNEGESGGQSINHLHLHILPRKEGDSGITEYEPRKFLYRPGSRDISPEAELKDVAELIKKELNAK